MSKANLDEELAALESLRRGLKEFDVTVRIRSPNKATARMLVRHAFRVARDSWRNGRGERMRGKPQKDRYRDLEVELAIIEAEYSVTHKAVRPVPEGE